MPDARHAVARQLADLVVREEHQVAVEQRIPVGVLRRPAAIRIEQRLRFVEVVPDGRHPLEIPLQVGPKRIDAVVDVAVVVVKHVLAPVGRLAVGLSPVVGLVDLVGVVPVHVAIAAVDVGSRHHRDDHVVPNLLDVGLVAHREAIRKFHQHFRCISLAAVQPGAEVVVRLRARDSPLRLVGAQAAGIGEPPHVGAIGFQVLQVRFGSDIDNHDLATLFGLANDRGFHATRQRLLERAIPLLLVSPVGQLLLRPDVIAEHVLRRGHAGFPRQVIDERRREVGPGRRRLHKRREIGIVGARRGSVPGCTLQRRRSDSGEREQDEQRQRCRPQGSRDHDVRLLICRESVRVPFS